MKKILIISLLFCSYSLFLSPEAKSGDRYSCAKKAAKAKTKFASNLLYRNCRNDKNLIFKSKRHNCALEAAEVDIAGAARRLYQACINK